MTRLCPPEAITSPCLIALAFVLAFVAACSDPAAGGGPDPAEDADAASDAAPDADAAQGDDAEPDVADADDVLPDAVEPTPICEAALLETQPWATPDLSGTRELWRLPNPTGGCTYTIWYPPVRAFAGGNPAILFTDPYNGIDWTGEEVDARWSEAAGAAGSVSMADVDGPGGGAGSTSIQYTRVAPAQTVDQVFIYLVNGLGVMIAYGRFYAGGDLTNDVGDMQAAMAHMATRPGVDPQRLGAQGGSWGAFEALYSALGEVKPRTVVALAPPIDFPDFEVWAQTGVPAHLTGERRAFLTTFYDPYLRRVRAAFARAEGPAPFTTASVCERLDSDLLLIHDSWDLLVPVEQSRHLAATCPGVEALIAERATPLDYATEPIDHGPIGRESGFPVQLSFGVTHALTALMPADQPIYTGYDPANLGAWLQRAREVQALGLDGAPTARRLLELCDARVLAFDLAKGGNPRPGCEVVAELVNAAWGTDLDADALREQLAASGLPTAP